MCEPQFTQIILSEEERTSEIPTSVTIENALEALHRDGIVVLGNAIDIDHLDKLNNRMVPESLELVKMETTHENGPGTGNISQVPPLDKEFLFADIFANPVAGAILSNILGPKPELRYLHGNTALKGQNRQTVHADLLHDHQDFPFAMVVNILLVDTSVKNGATEIWLGTHKRGNKGMAEMLIDEESLEERRKICPPIRAVLKKGSLIIRDLRLWHAGIPNQTDIPRIMLSMVYFPAWYKNSMRLKFPKSSEATVKALSKNINIIADYVPDAEFNHLTLEFKAEFNGGNREINDGEMARIIRYGGGNGKDLDNDIVRKFVRAMEK